MAAVEAAGKFIKAPSAAIACIGSIFGQIVSKVWSILRTTCFLLLASIEMWYVSSALDSGARERVDRKN